MYRSLSAEEKAQWETRSIQDKERFEDEMSRYVPPPGFDEHGVLIEPPPSTISSAQAKKMKKPRDPYAPKRARGSYVFFTNYIRPIIMKENPNTKFVELGAIMGERWRNISPEEKAKYEALANEDRNRLNREMEEYNAKKAEAIPVVNNYAMPQILDQVPTHYHHSHLQHLQQPQPTQDDAMALLSDEQQFQSVASPQVFMSLDQNQLNHSTFEPNQVPSYIPSSNQFSNETHTV